MSARVKYFSSQMPGSPQVSGAKGSLLSVLNACLVDGWGLNALDAIAVAAGVATASISTGHPFKVGQMVLVSDAIPFELNGEHLVTAVTTTTISFAAPSVMDGAATTPGVMKVAPLGWVRAFADVNKAAFHIDAAKYPASPTCLVRFDDNGGYAARVIGYESMTDVDTGLGQFPSVGQASSGLWVLRSESTNTSSLRSWFLIGDGRFFYLGLKHYTADLTNFGVTWSGFGEFKSTKSGDPFNFVIGANHPSDSSPSPDQNYSVASTTSSYQYLPRAHDGLGGSIRCLNVTWPNSYGASGGASAPLPYPNGPDYGVYLCKLQIFESSPQQYRGEWPGMYMLPHRAVRRICPDVVTPYFDNSVPGFTDRTIGFHSCAYSSSEWGVVAFDLTGPWDH